MPSANKHARKRKCAQTVSQREHIAHIRRVRTLPAALGDVDRVAGHDGLDREAHVAGLADRRRRRALALLDRARDAAADLQLRHVHGVEIQGAAGSNVNTAQASVMCTSAHADFEQTTLEMVSWRMVNASGAANAPETRAARDR